MWTGEQFRKIFPKKSEEDIFQCVAGLNGEIYRQMPGRRTLRFEVEGQGFFLKWHFGVGWYAIFSDWLRFRRPVLSARTEYLAIRACQKAQIPTLTPVAFGVRGLNPAGLESFLITQALDKTQSLESLCKSWYQHPPDFAFKKRLIERVARISRRLHENGINHRDYYLCHFLLATSGNQEKSCDFDLYLIDLHRAQVRKKTPRRWIVKDISALYFSALNIGLSRRDLCRFMRAYTQLPVRKSYICYRWIWRQIPKKIAKLKRRAWRYQKTA